MISLRFDKGQGLGNQLWCYATARVIALDNNYELGFLHPEAFKGSDFLHFDLSKKAEGILHTYEEKKAFHPLNGTDIRLYDPKLREIPDNTLVDGLLQDELYIAHRKNEIREWFKLRPEDDCRDYSDDALCIINFRGTGYVNDKELFLPQTYWNNAIANMRKINPQFTFIVVTEDPLNARRFFPHFEIYHWNMAKDYAVVKNAKYLILSNSSFAWFPAWLSTDLKYCIAPKYWARHNVSDGFWSLGYNLTTGWMYQDRKGILFDYASSKKEHDEYVRMHHDFYSNSSFAPSFLKTIHEEFRRYNTLRKDFGFLSALSHVILVLIARGLLFGKSLIAKKAGTPSRSAKNQPTSTHIQSAQSQHSTGSRLKDFIVKQGYY